MLIIAREIRDQSESAEGASVCLGGVDVAATAQQTCHM